jgi:hypothetical protein
MRARMQFFRMQLLRIVERNPELARTLDLNDNGRIDEGEAQLIVEYLFFDEKMREPHRAATPVDRVVDQNRDGRASGDEINAFR